MSDVKTSLQQIDSFRSILVHEVLPHIKRFHGDMLSDLFVLFEKFIVEGDLYKCMVLYVGENGTHSFLPEKRIIDYAGEHIKEVSGRAKDTVAIIVTLEERDTYDRNLIYKAKQVPFLSFYDDKEKYIGAFLKEETAV